MKIEEAVKQALEKSKKRKFTQTVELIINLQNIDLKRPENRINAEIVLPNGLGKQRKICVIAEGELAYKAKEMGLRVIARKDIEELAKNKRAAKKLAKNYDFFIAQADLMPLVGRYLGRFLGPRGKMPKPVPINADLKPIVERVNRTVRIRLKENPVIHLPVGSENMEINKIVENIKTVLETVESKLEKGKSQIADIYIKTTMGPAVKV